MSQESTASTKALPNEWEQSSSSSGYEPGDVKTSLREGVERRFWSVRRTPSVIASCVVALLGGLFLYDIIAVRADQPGMTWRRGLADELAARPLDDPWVLLGAFGALLLGLWLLVLALTPGLRGILPMQQPAEDVRAGLDRGAAATVLRDRAMQISGVQSVRVTVGRSRITARADSHFRDLDDVRADLEAVLGQGIKELGLAQQPALSVQVRRPAPKG